ncbi:MULTISPECIES: hypothetical protein [unclassified Microbacterium]|uniref:hypothetical protein n=1 Tax=unclassified Microbacterium TaxID=2609290 RepID=UPI00214B4279|nr:MULTISPECIES: hypothetical protein [unclassified Microbacterium]MCR2783780.1 hypothetical protein [Microbacterium sp. zg.B96]WIM15368.1 hypothetical protein QNO11_12590 [Microbacterium sp. zg-B96]
MTSALSLASTLPILYLPSRQLHRGFFVTLLPGLGLAAAMILVDQTFGSGAFGAVAIIPAVLSRNGIAPRK